MVIDSTMLDDTTDNRQQTSLCSHCGTSFSPPQPGSDPTTTRCSSCEADGSPVNGRRPHRRARLEPHSCTVCNKTFISSAHLNLHLASHSKERKFRCSTCGKYFHQNSHLMAHKMIHSGDRPFKCPECGKCFGRASHLKTHRRLHTGEKPFQCSYCSKSFTQKAGLLAHVQRHTSKQQSAPSNIQRQQPPSGPNDLKCGVCCRTFVRSSYFRLRLRLRKGYRPYHCRVCNKTFAKLESFGNHCDKHLRQKRENKQTEEKVVKPPLFVPLSRSSSPQSFTNESLSEFTTRSRAKAKVKAEP